MITQDY
jgi:hypothetical protein